MAQPRSEFVDYLVEVFEPFGSVTPKRMFGGYGIFYDGLMFALVAYDALYLKADAETKTKFTDRGLPCFEYEKQGKRMQMSYYAAPEEIFDDPDEARAWATLAFEAALRSRKK